MMHNKTGLSPQTDPSSSYLFPHAIASFRTSSIGSPEYSAISS